MKLVRMKTTFVLTLLAFIFAAAPLRAQQDAAPQNVADSVGDILHYTADQFLSLAEAMPAEKYDYVPNAPGGNFTGVRSFAEQVKHVACANFAFFNEIEGKTPPEHCEKGGPSPARTKAELVKYLKDSFEYGNKVAATLNAKNEMDQVDGQYGAPNTKLGVGLIAVWHIADHYGQIVEYVRLSGIVPPPTKEKGLQVR
jgi:hypothetical protein